MLLPTELLQAVSSPHGGKIALVVGAGCSVEPPTSVPVARDCSLEIHRHLVADGVLQHGDCADPTDLSLVADAVFAKKQAQRDVVERLREQYDLKLAKANDGYLIAAAMLCEGVICSVVTLNFDLALSNALSELGGGHTVGVIECPEDLPRQKNINVYYLHRNVNATDPELWVLRTAALNHDWRDHWESIITTRALTTPVVIFAGLGTPVAVLIESTKLLRKALPAATKLYQVDPSEKESSTFFQELTLKASDYIQSGWCQFMDEMSQRLLKEQIANLQHAVAQKVRDDRLPSENVAGLLDRFQAIGLVKLGKLRAHWLVHDKPYCKAEPNAVGLIADLLLAIAMVARVSSAAALVMDDGVVEFLRNGRIAAAYLIASGCGHRGRAAVEASLASRRKQYQSRPTPPHGAIVGGTSDSWTATLTPPSDILLGEMSDDIITGPPVFPMIHISELRADPGCVQKVVP